MHLSTYIPCMRGSPGDTGDKGRKGADGEQGEDGLPGANGGQGMKGPTGDQGPPAPNEKKVKIIQLSEDVFTFIDLSFDVYLYYGSAESNISLVATEILPANGKQLLFKEVSEVYGYTQQQLSINFEASDAAVTDGVTLALGLTLTNTDGRGFVKMIYINGSGGNPLPPIPPPIFSRATWFVIDWNGTLTIS